MPKFVCKVEKSTLGNITVEAETPEEAQEKADEAQDSEINWGDELTEVMSVSNESGTITYKDEGFAFPYQPGEEKAEVKGA